MRADVTVRQQLMGSDHESAYGRGKFVLGEHTSMVTDDIKKCVGELPSKMGLDDMLCDHPCMLCELPVSIRAASLIVCIGNESDWWKERRDQGIDANRVDESQRRV